MCIIAVKPQNVDWPASYVHNMCENNSHGFAAAWIEGDRIKVYRSIMEPKEIEEWYRKWVEEHDNAFIVLHARIATHGAKNEENCHGFTLMSRDPLPDGEDEDGNPIMTGPDPYDAVLFHNGTFSGITMPNKGMSDTWHMAQMLRGALKKTPALIENAEFWTMFEDMIGSNKVVILHNRGPKAIARYRILNHHLGEEYSTYDKDKKELVKTGVWTSNKSYEFRPRMAPLTTPFASRGTGTVGSSRGSYVPPTSESYKYGGRPDTKDYYCSRYSSANTGDLRYDVFHCTWDNEKKHWIEAKIGECREHHSPAYSWKPFFDKPNTFNLLKEKKHFGEWVKTRHGFSYRPFSLKVRKQVAEDMEKERALNPAPVTRMLPPARHEPLPIPRSELHRPVYVSERIFNGKSEFNVVGGGDSFVKVDSRELAYQLADSINAQGYANMTDALADLSSADRRRLLLECPYEMANWMSSINEDSDNKVTAKEIENFIKAAPGDASSWLDRYLSVYKYDRDHAPKQGEQIELPAPQGTEVN